MPLPTCSTTEVLETHTQITPEAFHAYAVCYSFSEGPFRESSADLQKKIDALLQAGEPPESIRREQIVFGTLRTGKRVYSLVLPQRGSASPRVGKPGSSSVPNPTKPHHLQPQPIRDTPGLLNPDD